MKKLQQIRAANTSSRREVEVLGDEVNDPGFAIGSVFQIMTSADKQVQNLYAWFHQAASDMHHGSGIDEEDIVRALAILRHIECDVQEAKDDAEREIAKAVQS